ncbi:MAG: DUF1800 family protein [Winogradskyella sp.]|uniref:DUF1800 family protein n=1 Tax=Winogradskyella sp. TaxID=1883156 RepID=UPI0017D9B03D|nr:DUF1800 family protein [Winogradskyella sp.]MBT8245109.1 DUF1800 domain-containing protein [Winogradskyella sp.]NNK23590.1 DUF1800 family protein [Winogradskyella sp.]
MKQEHIKHLYWRAGFGIRPEQIKANSKKSVDAIVNKLFLASENTRALKIDLSEFENLDFKTLKSNPNKLKELAAKSRKRILDLNSAWVDKMVASNDVLRERMTLFWANHFVCRDNNVVFMQQYNNTLRAHALGNFRDFVKAISREAAMVKYLNLKQNRKAQPNENFARELMELFTLGAKHYSEKDIKESARAFTGYSMRLDGNFIRFQV